MTESLIVGYAPGAWRVVATAHGVVMVDAAVPPTAVAALWTTLAEEVHLHRVLDALTVGTGGTLAALPSFAVVLREEGATRIAVRGALVASTSGGAEALELSGVGVTTWNERLVGAGAVRVAAIDAEHASFDLAVRDGVVLAGSIHVRWLDAVELGVPAAVPRGARSGAPSAPVGVSVDSAPPAGAPDPAPEPVADPAPEPAPVIAPPPAPWLVDGDALLAAPPSEPAPAAPERHDSGVQTLDAALRERASVPDDPPEVASVPGRARLSTGEILGLDRPVVIGRRPRATRVSATEVPHLVPVDSPLQDISRSHLELRVEGDVIVATDLQTTNGTLLLRPATAPTRLRAGEPTVVVPGDVLDIGDGVRVAIEGLG